MFCFDENTYDTFYNPETGQTGAVSGKVQRIFIKNVFLFNGVQGSTRTDKTIAHEGLHGLGLYHTHKDGNSAIQNPNSKYTFANGNVNLRNSTDNIMSYGQGNKKSTWQWERIWSLIERKQKKIIISILLSLFHLTLFFQKICNTKEEKLFKNRNKLNISAFKFYYNQNENNYEFTIFDILNKESDEFDVFFGSLVIDSIKVNKKLNYIV